MEIRYIMSISYDKIFFGFTIMTFTLMSDIIFKHFNLSWVYNFWNGKDGVFQLLYMCIPCCKIFQALTIIN